MRFITSVAILFVFLTGCVDNPKPESSTQVNTEIRVDKLFTYEGCTVHRFMDYGTPIYYTTCTGKVQWIRSCGKNCRRSVDVATNKSHY